MSNQELNATTPGVLPGGLNDTTWKKVFDALRAVAARCLDDADLADYVSQIERIESPWLDYIAQYAIAYPEWVTNATDVEKRARIAMWMRIRTCQCTIEALNYVIEAYGDFGFITHFANDPDDLFFEAHGFERTDGRFAIEYQLFDDNAHPDDCARFVKAVWPVGRCIGFAEQCTYDVWIVSFGQYKMNTIKGVKDYFNIGLAEAKAIVDATPTALSTHTTIHGGPYDTYAEALAVMNGLLDAIAAYTQDFDGVIEVREHEE